MNSACEATHAATARRGITRRAAVGGAMMLSALLAGCGLHPFGDDDSHASQLRAAEARWRESGFTSYRYVSRVSCFCASIGDADVTVLNGAVISVVRRSDGVSEPTRYRQSIDSLFAFVRREIDRQPERLRVSYDATLGYPLAIYWGTPENDGGGFIGSSEVQGLR
jgi:Family of unknown function (DUF6174)